MPLPSWMSEARDYVVAGLTALCSALAFVGAGKVEELAAYRDHLVVIGVVCLALSLIFAGLALAGPVSHLFSAARRRRLAGTPAVASGAVEAVQDERWTSSGLNWRIFPDGSSESSEDRVRRRLALVVIAPVAGSELPQPLEVMVTCAREIHAVTSMYRSAEFRPDNHRGSSSVIEDQAPAGKSVRVKLVSPKLLGPARLELWLVSEDEAKVEVLSVKRRLE